MKTLKEVELKDFVTTQKGYAFKSSWYQVEGVPIVKAGNFGENYVVNDNSLEKISTDVAEKFKKYELKEDDVLIQTVGSWPRNPNSVVGKVVKCRADVDGFLLNQNTVKIIPGKEIDQKFLYYLLKDNSFKSHVLKGARGAANQASVTLKDILSFKFNLPAKAVQEQISYNLSLLDSMVENNEKRIDSINSLLFLHFAKSQGISSEWKKCRLGDMVSVLKGKPITEDQCVAGGIPVIAGGVTPAYFHATANTNAPVITVSASGANSGFISLHHRKVWSSDSSFIDSTATPYVYVTYLILKSKQQEITNLQRGSAQPHVYPKDLMNFQVKYPIESTIKRLSQIYTPLFLEQANLKLQIAKLMQMRNELIPHLISGRIKLGT